MQKLKVGVLIFPKTTMLDAYAPHQMFAYVEQFETFIVAKTKDPLCADSGAILTANYDFNDCPDIDVLVVPGAADILDCMKDTATIDFLRKVGQKAQYVTSVCTGSLLLAEAGLLDGYKAATHWGYEDCLESYPEVTVVQDRVSIDRNRITAGGITAGIDYGLVVIGEVVGPDAAQTIQLIFQYDPKPPYTAGLPSTAPPKILQGVEPIISHFKGLGTGLLNFCQSHAERRTKAEA